MTRDEKILAAAEKLFFERSFDGVGVDEIGKVAGSSGSAIYRHFPSKDAILAALFDKLLDTLLIRIGEPDDDPAADVQKLLRAFVSLVKSHERLVAIWLREQRSLAERYRGSVDQRPVTADDLEHHGLPDPVGVRRRQGVEDVFIGEHRGQGLEGAGAGVPVMPSSSGRSIDMNRTTIAVSGISA